LSNTTAKDNLMKNKLFTLFFILSAFYLQTCQASHPELPFDVRVFQCFYRYQLDQVQANNPSVSQADNAHNAARQATCDLPHFSYLKRLLKQNPALCLQRFKMLSEYRPETAQDQQNLLKQIEKYCSDYCARPFTSIFDLPTYRKILQEHKQFLDSSKLTEFVGNLELSKRNYLRIYGANVVDRTTPNYICLQQFKELGFPTEKYPEFEMKLISKLFEELFDETKYHEELQALKAHVNSPEFSENL
jgi:hypothetical protein